MDVLARLRTIAQFSLKHRPLMEAWFVQCGGHQACPGLVSWRLYEACDNRRWRRRRPRLRKPVARAVTAGAAPTPCRTDYRRGVPMGREGGDRHQHRAFRAAWRCSSRAARPRRRPRQAACAWDRDSFRDSRQAWTCKAVASFTRRSGVTISYKTCRGGGTGRRTGLKILGCASSVRVQPPPPAPLTGSRPVVTRAELVRSAIMSPRETQAMAAWNGARLSAEIHRQKNGPPQDVLIRHWKGDLEDSGDALAALKSI
jgi:hypothetical protein